MILTTFHISKTHQGRNKSGTDVELIWWSKHWFHLLWNNRANNTFIKMDSVSLLKNHTWKVRILWAWLSKNSRLISVVTEQTLFWGRNVTNSLEHRLPALVQWKAIWISRLCGFLKVWTCFYVNTKRGRSVRGCTCAWVYMYMSMYECVRACVWWKSVQANCHWLQEATRDKGVGTDDLKMDVVLTWKP